MIRMIQSSSAAHAKAYFSEALAKADYYINDQELQGHIHGKLAERLGVTGKATKQVFFALCENTHPLTGEPLTPRTKDERTTGYDINFHCPKSVSILHALSKDDHLLEAFRQSVHQTMLDIEADAKTRVRKNNTYDDRPTGELVWADFIHQTARPVEGFAPDPHLHAHCFVFNATWDTEEQSYKAAQFRDIKRDMPYYQARFHKRLSDRLIDLGYEIRRTDKSFEVEGVPPRVIDLFSKRTDEIGRVAQEKGITDAKELDGLGARTRSKKEKGLSMTELKTDWKRQIHALDPREQDEGARVVRYPSGDKRPIKGKGLDPQQCLDHALQHGFERASVLPDRRLLETAYRQSMGQASVSLAQITDCFQADQRLIHVQEAGQTLCTTREVLAQEQRMVQLARAGQGKLRPLYSEPPPLALSGQQADAVRHLLTTTNRVSIIRGAAGSGKTTLMQEAVKHLEAAGKKVTVVAPTAQASRGVLKEEGFEKADTVAKLLVDKERQNQLQGQVLWVDEAGLLGTQDMSALLELVHQKNARLVLGGDTRQHAAVVRGDALRILNTVGGIQSAEVNKIYRQRNENYRAAVEDLARGAVKHAFAKLDAMGVIHQVDALNPHEQLVQDYTSALKAGKSALVVSPTHQQGDELTQAIRQKLRAAKQLGKKEITLPRLVNLNLTEAEKSDWRNLREGMHVQFNQNGPGFKRGSVWTVESSSEKGVRLKDENQATTLLPLERSKDFELYQQSQLPLSKGDWVRLTRNGFDQQNKRLNNGELLKVSSVNKKGELVLQNRLSKTKFRLGQDYGHLAHAYCITSHASQGKTVDEVFIFQPAATFPATDAKQFYVSVSRGRDGVHVYTDHKEELMQYAQRLGDRTSALELVRKKNQERVQQRMREERHKSPAAKTKTPQRNPSKVSPVKLPDHEPRI